MSETSPEVALAKALEEHYPEAVLRELGTDDPNTLAAAALHPDKLDELASNDSTFRALAALLHVGEKRLGGLRREAILAGYGDVSEGLLSLIQDGVLVVVQAPGQRDWTMATLLETRQYLQREFTIPTEVFNLLEPRFRVEVEAPSLVIADSDVKPHRRPAPMTLELNLLHMAHGVRETPLSINRDGSGHRRVVNKLATDVSYAPLNDTENEAVRTHYLHFLKALLIALGTARVEERQLALNVEKLRALFSADTPTRDKALLRAYKACGLWREVHAAALIDEKESEYVDSLLADPAPLGGLRGQVWPTSSNFRWTAGSRSTRSKI